MKTLRTNERAGTARLSRRDILRGVGAAICLPYLEALGKDAPALKPSSDAPTERPVRAAYLYFPNGAAEGSWHPRKVGKRGELLQLNEWMAPLEAHRQDLIIPQKMWTPRGNGHAAGTTTWLTGAGWDRERIDAGGASVDQVAAQAIGDLTVLPSLELSMRGEGYFSKEIARNTLSWQTATLPASREIEPRAVFDRMFRGGETSKKDRSVLDLVLSQARRLKVRVSGSDGRKVDQYLDAVRALEKRISFAEKQTLRARDDGGKTDTLSRPQPGIPSDHSEYMRIMLDLVVLAFWSDATRVCTFMLDHGQSNRYFEFVDGVKGTWHALSHWKDASGKTEDDDGKTSWSSVASKRDQYNAVTRWHHEQVAYFLKRLKESDDGEGNLLDNSIVLYGSSLSDGHEHSAKDLPLILAGRGGGTIRSGRQLKFERDTSLSRVHLATLKRLGVKADRFAETDEPLTEWS